MRWKMRKNERKMRKKRRFIILWPKTGGVPAVGIAGEPKEGAGADVLGAPKLKGGVEVTDWLGWVAAPKLKEGVEACGWFDSNRLFAAGAPKGGFVMADWPKGVELVGAPKLKFGVEVTDWLGWVAAPKVKELEGAGFPKGEVELVVLEAENGEGFLSWSPSEDLFPEVMVEVVGFDPALNGMLPKANDEEGAGLREVEVFEFVPKTKGDEPGFPLVDDNWVEAAPKTKGVDGAGLFASVGVDPKENLGCVESVVEVEGVVVEAAPKTKGVDGAGLFASVVVAGADAVVVAAPKTKGVDDAGLSVEAVVDPKENLGCVESVVEGVEDEAAPKTKGVDGAGLSVEAVVDSKENLDCVESVVEGVEDEAAPKTKGVDDEGLFTSVVVEPKENLGCVESVPNETAGFSAMKKKSKMWE